MSSGVIIPDDSVYLQDKYQKKLPLTLKKKSPPSIKGQLALADYSLPYIAYNPKLRVYYMLIYFFLKHQKPIYLLYTLFFNIIYTKRNKKIIAFKI